MKRTLRIIAGILIVGAIAFWAATGANRGWTKTRVPKKIMDEAAGLEGIQWQEKFVPGVDFLGAALLGAGVLTGLSFLSRAKSNNPPTETKQ
ncbi:MAG: hypothetical protein ABSC89_05340 [Verrucomicrobiota bacterium]|jgi:hypothetical protein